MATTIQSTQLDFFAIKNNLKKFLQEKEEFSDYNFEASGLSNILDVLAYNTHYNSLVANFATNESYLNTAQLRESVVSLAAAIGYVPTSKTSSQATVKIILRLNVSETENQIRPTTLTIPEFTRFKANVDGVTYTFQNIEDLKATDNNGVYEFRPISNEDANPTIYEGTRQTKNFVVGANIDSTVFVIPDGEMDTQTAVVRVFESPASRAFIVYEDLAKATLVDEDTPLYILNESPNGFYELSFGVGTTLGATPVAGNKIEVNYLRSSGAVSDGASTFTTFTDISFPEVTGSSTLSIVTETKAAGGGEKEDIESVRKNAPFQYASQNRMVTANDYTSLIQKNFRLFIKDIVSFGGEDALEPEYGTVFTSIVFKDNISNQTINKLKAEIRSLADRVSVASFDLKFLDPKTTFISSTLTYEFDPTLTGLSESSITTKVDARKTDFFFENTGRFGQSFRRSNLLTKIDEVDPSILSSRTSIVVQKRLFPTPFAEKNYKIKFPVPLQQPKLAYETSQFLNSIVVANRSGAVELPYATVYSSLFRFNGQVVQIRNSLNQETEIKVNGIGTGRFEIVPSTNLELYNISTASIEKTSIGSFNPDTGVIDIETLQLESIVGGANFLKIFAIPANESLINVSLNEILQYDQSESSSRAVVTSQE